MGLLSTTGGKPALSWNDAPKGSRIKGVVVPTEDGRPYSEQQQTKSGEPDVKLFYDNGDPRMQAVLTIQTDLRNFEFTSLEFQQARTENGDDEPDDGVRRLFIAGKQLTGKTRKAIAKAKGKDVEVGATIEVETQGKVALGGGKTERQFEVDYARPTPASLAIAQATAAALYGNGGGGSLATDGADGDDGADDSDPPPFA
jgi:hypothetical protein